MNAIVKAAVDPKFALTIALVLGMPALRADEKPPDSLFQQSPLELTIKTPPSFKPTRSTTGYLPTPVGNCSVSRSELGWKNGGGCSTAYRHA